MKIVIIGLGDVGRCYATALSKSGHSIFDACDSYPNTHIEEYAREVGANLHAAPGPWLAEADLVISAVFGNVALDVARQSLAHMHKGAIYADFTTANPGELAIAGRIASEAAIHYIDVAIIGAIGIRGAQTPLLCAGPNTNRLIEIMQSIGAPIRGVGSVPGDAIALKLLRSVFTKGLEASAVECLIAAEHMGLRHELYNVLSDIDQTPIKNLIEAMVISHVRHAGRRLIEVQEARAQLLNAGVCPLAIDGAAALFMRTSESIQNGPSLEELTLENSLNWLFDQQNPTNSTHRQHKLNPLQDT